MWWQPNPESCRAVAPLFQVFHLVSSVARGVPNLTFAEPNLKPNLACMFGRIRIRIRTLQHRQIVFNCQQVVLCNTLHCGPCAVKCAPVTMPFRNTSDIGLSELIVSMCVVSKKIIRTYKTKEYMSWNTQTIYSFRSYDQISSMCLYQNIYGNRNLT
jgi:hypothetical protein